MSLENIREPCERGGDGTSRSNPAPEADQEADTEPKGITLWLQVSLLTLAPFLMLGFLWALDRMIR